MRHVHLTTDRAECFDCGQVYERGEGPLPTYTFAGMVTWSKEHDCTDDDDHERLTVMQPTLFD